MSARSRSYQPQYQPQQPPRGGYGTWGPPKQADSTQELITRLDQVVSMLSRVSQQLDYIIQILERAPAPQTQARGGQGRQYGARGGQEGQRQQQHQARGGKKAIDVLKDQGVVTAYRLSGSRSRRQTNALIRKLAEQGAVVIPVLQDGGVKDIIVAHPDAWSELSDALPNLPPSEDEVEKELSRQAAELFKVLRQADLLIKSKSGKWRLTGDAKPVNPEDLSQILGEEQ